ncbi:hypothetical protein F383_19578 [Gossypium arboreum]|uniref:Uncharacterized protein n=1 Tax=Gossypium arboreum TaxID=29729 RepID=A0A0B0ND71_GOSAR|nr:hypothetical protein F383_19578 [Gossypium arboreum]
MTVPYSTLSGDH